MKLPNLRLEKELWRRGYKYVCGIDEVGRGAWAGPVVAAAVVFSPDLRDRPLKRDGPYSTGSPGLRDSKQLSPKQREFLDPIIKQKCLAYSVSTIGVKTINREGIVKSSQKAYRKCLRLIEPRADFILMDAFYIKNLPRKNQKAVIRGDQKSFSIAAASIIAKVYRDNLMVKLHNSDGRYGFDRHKGYGTKIHRESIKRHGLSQEHRIQFVPKDLIAGLKPNGNNSNNRKTHAQHLKKT